MKKEFIETFSIEDLAKQGYKQRADQREWYLGDSKFPTHTIRQDIEHLLGQKFEVLNVTEGKVLVTQNGEEYYIKQHLIKKLPPKRKIEKRIFRNEVIVFHGYGFDFPCDMRHMGIEEARETAEWILKITQKY